MNFHVKICKVFNSFGSNLYLLLVILYDYLSLLKYY